MTWKETEKIAKEKLGVGDDYVMYGYKLLGSEGMRDSFALKFHLVQYRKKKLKIRQRREEFKKTVEKLKDE